MDLIEFLLNSSGFRWVVSGFHKDLLCSLRDEHPGIQFAFVIGSDWPLGTSESGAEVFFSKISREGAYMWVSGARTPLPPLATQSSRRVAVQLKKLFALYTS